MYDYKSHFHHFKEVKVWTGEGLDFENIPNLHLSNLHLQITLKMGLIASWFQQETLNKAQRNVKPLPLILKMGTKRRLDPFLVLF